MNIFIAQMFQTFLKAHSHSQCQTNHTCNENHTWTKDLSVQSPTTATVLLTASLQVET
jgi:hypothetical protein